MQAARNQNSNTAALRNQLLSTDIGNIDVRDELTIKEQQHLRQQQHQHAPFYPGSNGLGPIPPQGQRFNGPMMHPQQQQQQYYTQPMPPSMPYAPSSPSSKPRSRRSSIQSNNSSFNMSSMSNFIKHKSKSRSKFSVGGDDDDEDGKDVMIDDNGATMSFDDLSTLKDRGRYGGQSSYDSTPIIPTLASPASIPSTGNGGHVSNAQYRKQMTAYKKHVMANAGKIKDPRAMSLQSGTSMYNDPRAMSLQGGNSMYSDPRAMSLQGGNRMYNDPKAMSLQGGNSYLGATGPRSNSMTGQVPYMNPQQPRSNSLMNQQSSMQHGPRAYSLTTNPYQQQKLQQQAHHFDRQPANLNGTQPPSNQHFANGLNNTLKFGSQTSSISPRNPASSLLLNQRPLSAGHQIPPIQLQRISLQERPSSSDSSVRNSNGALPSSFGGYNPSTPTIEETPALTRLTNNEQPREPLIKEKDKLHEVISSKQLKSPEHHYLADNTLDNNSLDDSGVTYSDFSASQEKSFIAPNDESTPSPGNTQKHHVSHNIQNVIDDSTEFDEDETPSKLPRSKALPHLSLLKIRDEVSDDSLKEYNQPQTQTQHQQPSRVLEPVSEIATAQSYPTRNTTPPLKSSNEFSRRNSPTKSPFGTPGRNKSMPAGENMSSSPLKRQTGSMENGHKKFALTAMSISSMSEYSAFSDGYDNPIDSESKKKIYQLAESSGTTNDVFVTASQFSLNDNTDHGDSRQNSRDCFGNKDLDFDSHRYIPDTIKEGDSYASDVTPKINDYVDNHVDDTTPIIEKPHRLSHSYDPSIVSNVNDSNASVLNDVLSINSSKNGSIKKSFKSPKFLQKWSKKRSEKKKNNTFEPVTKPVEIKSTQPFQPQHGLSKIPSPTKELPPNPTITANIDASGIDKIGIDKIGAIPSKGLHIMNGGYLSDKKDDVDYQKAIHNSLDPGIPTSRGLAKSGDKRTITSQEEEDDVCIEDASYSGRDNNNISSQPTSASGTQSSYSTNNTIDTEPENEFDGSQNSKHAPSSTTRELPVINVKPNGQTTGINRKLESSFEPETETVEAPKITRKLNLTVDQLGIMEDKSLIVRELELVSKELGDSIRREIELEDQIKRKNIIPSPKLNYANELREKALMISKLEASLNEERRKRYIAEEHVLLWENDTKPSALQLSYENEKVRSELSNMNEIINKQSTDIESLRYDYPKNEDEVDSLTRKNKQLETVTIPSLKNEIEFLNNDKKRLLDITERFKQLKNEKAELETKLKEVDDTKSRHLKRLEDELARMKQKYEQKAYTTSESATQSPINNRIRKTFLTELGGSNSSDSVKPPSPINTKRINSFSLINVTSPNGK